MCQHRASWQDMIKTHPLNFPLFVDSQKFHPPPTPIAPPPPSSQPPPCRVCFLLPVLNTRHWFPKSFLRCVSESKAWSPYQLASTRTSSIAFRHLPPNSARTGYATEGALHSPSIAFRHLPQNSARTGYATEGALHTPSIAFRRLPPISDRTGYATDGALFISAQMYVLTLSALSERFGYS